MNIFLTITVHYTSESSVNESPLVSLYAICCSLSSRTKILSKITYTKLQYRCNLVHYSTILHMALQCLRQKINNKQSKSSNLCRAKQFSQGRSKCSLYHFRTILNIQCTEIRSPFSIMLLMGPTYPVANRLAKNEFRVEIRLIGKTFLVKSLPVPKWCGTFYYLMTICAYWCVSRTPRLLQGNGF